MALFLEMQIVKSKIIRFYIYHYCHSSAKVIAVLMLLRIVTGKVNLKLISFTPEFSATSNL